nr:Chain C, Peptide inhibitor [synthetic construct]5VB9_D Chain D, Peptide inhibitor [synthetic construct]
CWVLEYDMFGALHCR